MSRIDRLLNRGISFVKSGREEDARSLLRAVIADEPENRLAWGWYVQSFCNEDERIQAFEEYLRIFPNDQNAIKLQASLLKSQNNSWKRLANDAVQEVDWLKRESAREIQRRDHIIYRTRLLSVVISLVLLGGFFVASSGLFTQLTSLSRQHRLLKAEHDALEKTYQALGESFVSLNTNYNDLADQHNSLVDEHNGLVDVHNTLVEDYQSLDDEHNRLVADFAVLSDEYSALVTQHNSLINDYNTLTGQHQELIAEHDVLLGDYNWLEYISVQPPYIVTNGRNVKLAFKKLDGSIIHWEVPFSSLEYDLQRGNTLRGKINTGSGDYFLKLSNTTTNENYTVTDVRYFVDPSPFDTVIGDLYYEIGDDQAFVLEVWNIVAQLTSYSTELSDTPRYPLETLLAGGGDCEDTAILFASMILAAPVDWKVQMVYMDSENPTNPLTMNHVIVHVTTRDRSYDVETTDKYEIDPYEQGVNGWYFEVNN